MNDHRTSFVYAIKNKINGLMYIGSTDNLKKRIESHLEHLKAGIHNYKLQKAWNEFGENAFEFIVIEKDIPLLKQFIAEQYWLDTFKSYKEGYNVNPKAGSYVPLTEQDKHEKALQEIDSMLSEIKNKIIYRKIAKKYKVSVGFVALLKRNYLPEIQSNRRLTTEQKIRKLQLKLQTKRKQYEKIQMKNAIIKDLTLGKTYRQIKNKFNVPIGTIGLINKMKKNVNN
jgi:group I intron endonuclease